MVSDYSSFGGDGGKPKLSLRSLLRNLSHFMSLLLTQKTDYAVSITARIKNNPITSANTDSFGLFAFGGDGGNRNRVRKLVHTTFSGCSQSFDIPSQIRRMTGLSAQYPLMRDGIRGCSAVHVHCWSTPESEPQYSQVRRARLRSL